MQIPAALRYAVAVTLGAAGLVGTAAIPSSAAPPAGTYVNLGDSYSAGWGAYAPASGINPVMGSPACFIGGRPDDITLFSQTESLPLAGDYACAGATVGATTSATPTIPQQAAKAHADGALDNRTTIVTLTGGGNDVRFGDIIGACAADTTPTALQCQAAVAAGLLAAQRVDVGGTVDTIRRYATRAHVAWMGYPHLFAASNPVMSPAATSVFNLGTDAFNAVLAFKAVTAGAQFVSVTGTFTGHEIGSSNSWFNLSQDPLLAPFNFHPTADGYLQGYTPAMIAQIRLGQSVLN